MYSASGDMCTRLYHRGVPDTTVLGSKVIASTFFVERHAVAIIGYSEVHKGCPSQRGWSHSMGIENHTNGL